MKKFKPHMMYKDGKAVKANTYEEHLSLKKKGYGHSKKESKMPMVNGKKFPYTKKGKAEAKKEEMKKGRKSRMSKAAKAMAMRKSY